MCLYILSVDIVVRMSPLFDVSTYLIGLLLLQSWPIWCVDIFNWSVGFAKFVYAAMLSKLLERMKTYQIDYYIIFMWIIFMEYIYTVLLFNRDYELCF